MTLSLLRRLIVLLFLVFSIVAPGVVETASASPGIDYSKIDPELARQMALEPAKKRPVIVEMRLAAPPTIGSNEIRAKAARSLLEKLGKEGYPVGELPIVNGAVGFASAKGIQTLSRNGDVRYIHEDSVVSPRVSSDEQLPTRPPGQLSAPYPRVIGADRVWLAGPTGKGIAVAVLDSGITSHPDLTSPVNRIVARANFADTLSPGASPDPGGHGTHVAGIIAGNGTHSDLSQSQNQPTLSGRAELVEYVGVAPGANLVDVRVLNSAGYGRVSSVIRGIEWVLEHKDAYNIRVINLSVGAPAHTSYRFDVLSAAVEIAWKRGLVVVAAAGNGGPSAGTVERPGVDPFVITVGATDDLTTLPATDDVVAPFSAWGLSQDTGDKPDLVAPGRRVVSLRTDGSFLDVQFPERVVTARSGADYFRLTGTSMATAVVSGTVALMLEQSPWLNPDQVKAALTSTTQVYGQDAKAGTASHADGAGLLDAHAAVFASAGLSPANVGLRPADTTARALYSALYGQALFWKDPQYGGIDWYNLAWDNLAWDNLAWDNLAWDNLAWDNLAWDNLAWDNLAWDNLAWDNLAWDTTAWSAMTLD